MKCRACRAVISVALLMVMGGAFVLPASADTLVQFETTSTGTRVLTSATAPAFPAVNDLNVSTTISTVTPATSLVTEVFAHGSNPWSVKAQMCGPDIYASPTAGDCVGKPARMERADGDTIAGASINVSHGAPVVTVGGGSTSAGTEANLGGQITLLLNTGQNTATTYNGTYASTTSLSISNFNRIGVWKGMWVVTATL